MDETLPEMADLDHIAQAILSERDARIWRKFYRELYSYEELAKEESCVRSTVGLSLQRSRVKVVAAYRTAQHGVTRYGVTIAQGSNVHFATNPVERKVVGRA